MRALVIFLFVLGAVAFMASCGTDVTEVSWKNASGSVTTVHEIVWFQDNIAWQNTSTGYPASGFSTDAKEVTSVSSDVTCAIWNGTSFDAVSDFTVTGGKYASGKAVTLNEGESQVLSLYVP